jgi:DNA-binding response OmpR family regulator
VSETAPTSVLIVEDDIAVVNTLREALRPHNVVLEAAGDVMAANALLSERQFCGLVLDLVLERGSGFDVLHHISEQKLRVPTIVLTAKLPEYVREMLDAENVKLVFPKPMEPRLLATVVLALCGVTP